MIPSHIKRRDPFRVTPFLYVPGQQITTRYKKSPQSRGLGGNIGLFDWGQVFQAQVQNGSGVGEGTAGDKVYAGFGDLP